MNEQFKQNALSWGENGKLWLETIPALIAEYEIKWSLKVLAPFDLSYNYVAPAKRFDGSDVVLKIGYPEDKEFQTEIKALTLFKGEGIARLLESDADKSVILIEAVKPGVPLSSLDSDDEATRIIASVMKKLHKPLPLDHSFITISEWMSAIRRYEEIYPKEGPLPIQLVKRADELFQELIETSDTPVLVHGDLHHDNILSSRRDHWLAIDPKGIAAEPAYEVAAMIRNPYEKLRHISNLEPLLRRRILLLSDILEIEHVRLYKWCLVQTVLSAVWNIEAAKVPGHSGKVAAVLADMTI
jgi:streptomycin 6-kinase